MSVEKYLTFNGLAYFLNKIKSTMADELDGKSDVGHTHTKSEITDFPTLATVATSGSYDDLSDKPIIPDVSNYYTKEEILALLEDYQRKGDKTWVN